jgi:hypothetical protein
LQLLRGASASVGIDWVSVGTRLQQTTAQQSIDGHFHGGLLHICCWRTSFFWALSLSSKSGCGCRCTDLPAASRKGIRVGGLAEA